jgi:predicted outer membrane repeat protein
VAAIDGSTLPHGISISGSLKSTVLTVPQCSDAFLTGCTVRDAGFNPSLGASSGCGLRNYGHLILSRCSVVHNRAKIDGGGIYNEGTLHISNSTIAENRADRGGGIANDGVTVLENTTVSANHAQYSGGAIYAPYADKNHLINTILAGNSHGGNLHGTVHLSEGINFLAGDPQLAPLGYYGGPTPIMPPLAGSPVINPAGGMASSALLTDQRGQPRIVQGVLDIGAVEWNAAPARFPADGATGLPARHAKLFWNVSPNAIPHEVFIGTSPGSLASAGVTTTGVLELASLAPATTYFWRVDSTNGGVTTSGPVWQFTTRAAFLVTTASDAETGTSLRAILNAVRLADGGDLIQFAPSLAGATITLSGTPLIVEDDLLIDATPLSEGPKISGAALSGVFEVGPFATAELAGFTITGGRASSGGGILCEYSDLSLDNMTLAENQGTMSGGGAFVREGKLHIENSTIHGNQAGNGGGLYVTSGNAELSNTTIANNKASAASGGIRIYFSQLLLRHVTVTGNQAPNNGGLSTAGTSNGSVTLEGSILAGNIAPTAADLDFSPASAVSCLIGGNPRLAPLASYGGRTPVMPPLPGSPSIDRVPPASTTPPTDQRGFHRFGGPAADAGAVEAFPFVSLGRIDSDGDGVDDRLEPALGLTVGQIDGGRDSDGDGDSDANELDNMTDPQSSLDYFRVLSMTGTTSNLEIRFSSFPGLSYRLARSADLINFTLVAGSEVTAADVMSSIKAPNDPAPAFFRVERITTPPP